MNDIVKFSLLVVFGLIPFGYGVVWLLYRKTIIFSTAMTVFIGAMGVGIVSFTIGVKGFLHLTWGIPVCLVWLVAMNAVAKKLIRQPLRELNNAIKEMANGNLSINVELSSKSRQNEIGEISVSVEKLYTEIYNSTHNISKSSEEVLKMSSEIAATSDQLSMEADQQVMVVEQLKESMGEMNRVTSENTISAKESELKSELSASEILAVNNQMNSLVKSMNDIEDYVGRINEIAHQTNILALNAAVEAARAGEHGKGFAVVAAEVRKLAENSRSYADEIVNTINQGVSISNSTAESLVQSVPKIQESVELIKKISEGSTLQREENDKVTQGISVVDTLNMDNSERAKLLGKSAHTLKEQASSLKQAVEFFRFQ